MKRKKLKRRSSTRITTLNPEAIDYLRGPGRPRRGEELKTELSAEDLKVIYRTSQLGMTVEQIAHVLEMSIDSFYKFIKDESSGAKDALERGRALAIKYVTEKLWGGIEQGKMSAILFYLRCRAGWSERRVLEVPGLSDLALSTQEETEKTLKHLKDDELQLIGKMLTEAEQRRITGAAIEGNTKEKDKDKSNRRMH